MKKLFTFLLLAVGLQAWALPGDQFSVGSYSYEIVTDPTTTDKGVAVCVGLSSSGQSLTSINIPYVVNYGRQFYVKRVNDEAFANNTKITSVRFSYGIQVVGTGAFRGCTNITNVRLPSSITMLGIECFDGCNKINTVYYAGSGGSGIATYRSSFTNSSTRTLYVPWGTNHADIRAKYAFGTTKIATITNSSQAYDYLMTDGTMFVVTNPSTSTSTPHECTIIGFASTASGVYDGRYYPSSQVFPQGQDRNFRFTAVADSAFLGNTGLVELDMSRATGIETFGRNFAGKCPNLTSATLASGELDYRGFSGNTKLTTVVLDGVKKIGPYAFSGCTSLTTLNIPASVLSIQTGSFVDGSSALVSISVASDNPNFSSDASAIYNKAKTTLFRVPEGHMYYDKAFPPTLKTISAYAFYNVKGIGEVKIPYGVTTIGNEAFYGCSGLTNVYIPSSVKTLGTKVFSNCTSLNKLYVNCDNAPTINKADMFYGAKNPNLYVQRNMQEIFKDAGWTDFLSYNNNSVVARDYEGAAYIDYTVTSTKPLTIDGNNYDGQCKVVRGSRCANVTGATTIPTHIFINSKKYAVTRIEELAFNTSKSFSIEGCALVDTVGRNAFYEVPITSISLPYVSVIQSSAFSGCAQLTTAKWGNRVYFIGSNAFKGSSLNHDIILPVGTYQVNANAFNGVNSKLILLPSTIHSTGIDLFTGMSSLENIIVNFDAFYSHFTYNFDGVPASCKVHVPVGYMAKAKGHANWSKFGNNIKEGAFDFCYTSPNPTSIKPLTSQYTLTVTSTNPVTVDGVTYDGKAKYVYNPNLKTATSFVPDNAEVDRMTMGEKRYLITEIGDSCFYKSSVKTVAFSRMGSLNRIGKKAFFDSELTRADFDQEHKINFGYRAFSYADNLTEIVVRNGLSWDDEFFGYNDNSFLLYVPNQMFYRYVYESSLKDYRFDADETCADRVAPCFTAAATTYDIGASVSFVFSPQDGYNAYVVKGAPNPVTHIIPTQRYTGNCFGNTGVILTDLIPGNFYKVKRLLRNNSTVESYHKPVFTDLNLNTVSNSYYWDTEARKFIKSTGSQTVKSGRTYLVADGGAPEFYLDIFAPATSNGDVNGDGNIDIADVNIIINITLGKATATSYPAADVNGDEGIDVSDINAALNIMLGK